MKPVKEALRAKLLADSTLVSLLGGQHVYQRAPEVTATTCVTFHLVSESRDTTGRVDQAYQFDAWAPSADLADQIADRVSTVLGWRESAGGGTLTITGRRLLEPIYSVPGSVDSTEQTETGQIHQRSRQFRVVSVAN